MISISHWGLIDCVDYLNADMLDVLLKQNRIWPRFDYQPTVEYQRLNFGKLD